MLNFFISGTFHEWWQTYHERWLDWNRRSNFPSKSKSQIWKRMMEFFITSVNKQLQAIEKLFGAKNQKFKSQKFKETECFSWVVTKFLWVMTHTSLNFPVPRLVMSGDTRVGHFFWVVSNGSFCIKNVSNGSFSFRGFIFYQEQSWNIKRKLSKQI